MSTTYSDVATLRSKLWQNGFRPVPVYSPACVCWKNQGLANAGKHAKGDKWPEQARTNPPEAVKADVEDRCLNTGILCDGLQAVDIDIDDPAIAVQVASLAGLHLGNAPLRSRADSPRCLYLYRATNGEPSKRILGSKPGCKVEILGLGQQFVAYGTHPDGSPYQWPNGGPDSFHRDQLTAVTEEAVQAFLEAVAPLIGAQAPTMPRAVPVPSPKPSIGEPGWRDFACADKAFIDEIGLVRTTPQGQGHNDQLFKSAANLYEFVANGSLDGQRVTDALMQASIDAGYADTPSWRRAAMKTIEQGYKRGTENPRPLKRDAPNVAAIDTSGIIPGAKHSSAPADKSNKRGINLVKCSTVQIRAIDWLWKGFVPKGKLALLAGKGGVGKSTLAFSLAATVSNGGIWPDGTRCKRAGNVLIWSSEDGEGDTIIPRLIAAGANLDRCYIVKGATDDSGESRAFDPGRDIDLLRETAKQIGEVALLIIDPVSTAVMGDSSKTNVVRRALQPIVDLAAEINCSVIGITHFGKATQGKDTQERVIDSQAFVALARIVLVAAKEKDSERRVFAIAKSNICKDRGGFNFSIEEIDLGMENEVTKVVWGEPLDGTAFDILSEVEDETKAEFTQLGAAKQFLIESLQNGPVSSKELIEHAREGLGIPSVTLRRAQKELSIIASKTAFTGGWMWSLPICVQPH